MDVAPALGWPAQYGDAANSSYTTTAGSSKLALKWTRSVKGSLAAGPALSGRGYLALNSQTPAGCSLMEWENNDNAGNAGVFGWSRAAASPVRCSTDSTTSTSASRARSLPSPSPSGHAGANR
ncbi:pyrrolo-quinoline quinone domain protein [Mycobacterium ulcerans str. Harvey]|uniref:Pyrrolo-quinoline quinone domain protein n=1 Tax=Mycobacterium ulcerans str. Harvey TaxID=1299332 RepID=A0ABN0QUC3_MYCUL|nr:pyrrolo-quinoline quinone domain protein [Mycobacterium ulcerans str. Harvey]